MPIEYSPDRVLAGRFSATTPLERARLTTLVITGVILFLLLWNFFFVVVAFESMPRNDFGRPLMATQLFLRGNDMYGETEAVRYQYKPTKIIHLWDLNPPHSHLLYIPLAVMPSSLALAAWFAVSGLCLYGSIQIIVSELGIELTPRRLWWLVIGLLSFSAMGIALVTAHISFPMTLVVTLAWRDARHGRWGKAGCWLGLVLSIKPFLLIFVPYLVLKCCWRGLAALGLTIAAAFLLGLVVFGVESHHSWLRMLSRADSWAWLPLNASLYGMISRLFIQNPMFTSIATLDPGVVRTAWLVLGIPAGIVALLRTLADPIREGADRAFAILLVSAVLLSPLGWIYYFWLPMGPVAAIAYGWGAERTRRAGGASGLIGSPSGNLFLVSMAGMACPTFLVTSFQPSALATLLVGCIPFWSLLFIWLALILDGLDPRLVRARIASMWSDRSPGQCADHKLVSGSP
jgi:hypothetical protein